MCKAVGGVKLEPALFLKASPPGHGNHVPSKGLTLPLCVPSSDPSQELGDFLGTVAGNEIDASLHARLSAIYASHRSELP